jgi:hypothetical protein
MRPLVCMLIFVVILCLGVVTLLVHVDYRKHKVTEVVLHKESAQQEKREYNTLQQLAQVFLNESGQEDATKLPTTTQPATSQSLSLLLKDLRGVEGHTVNAAKALWDGSNQRRRPTDTRIPLFGFL